MCVASPSLLRLDRLASGVLVIARSTEKAALFHKHLRQDFIEKEYLARVKVLRVIYMSNRREKAERIRSKPNVTEKARQAPRFSDKSVGYKSAIFCVLGRCSQSAVCRRRERAAKPQKV